MVMAETPNKAIRLNLINNLPVIHLYQWQYHSVTVVDPCVLPSLILAKQQAMGRDDQYKKPMLISDD